MAPGCRQFLLSVELASTHPTRCRLGPAADRLLVVVRVDHEHGFRRTERKLKLKSDHIFVSRGRL